VIHKIATALLYLPISNNTVRINKVARNVPLEKVRNTATAIIRKITMKNILLGRKVVLMKYPVIITHGNRYDPTIFGCTIVDIILKPR
jgi:hypothetical protein